MSATNVGSATGYLDLDISGFLAGLKTAQDKANDTSGNIATQVGKSMTSVGKSLTSAGTALTKDVTVPVVGLGTAIVTVSANFESGMSKVQAISGATGGNLEALKAKAQEMGAKTKFSATEAAEAFQYMAMAGWDTNDMLNSVEGVMNLAAASGEELGTVSDIVTDAMTAFGLSASGTSTVLKDGLQVEVSNCTRFVDALAAASNSSNTNVAMLGESFKYVAPVAGALGYSVEDVAIALGMMANQGIKSSQAGTSLRTMLTNMANPTDTMTAAMNALDVSLENDDGSMKSLMEVMQDLRKGFGGGSMDAEDFAIKMSDLDTALQDGTIKQEDYEQAVNDLCVAMYGAEGAQKAQLAAMLAGKTGMAGLLAIVNTTEEDFNNLTDSIYNASGTSQEMADIMMDNLSGQLTILKSQLEGVALQLGEILMPYVKKFVEWLQQLVQKFSELSPEQQEQIVKFAAIAAVIGPVLLVVGKLVTSIGGMITTFGKIPSALATVKGTFTALGTAIGGISAPVVAVAAVIGVLVAAFATLWKTNEDFRNKITAMWDEIKAKFDEAGQKITDAINSLGFNFSGIVDALKAAWEGFCNLLAPLFLGVVENVKSIISGIVDVFTGIIQAICGVIKGFKDGDWTLLLEGFKSIFNGVISVLLAPLKGIWRQFTEILESLGTSWEECWTGIKTFFEGIWNGIKTFFVGAWNSIKTIFTNAVNTVTTFFSNAWNGLVDIVTTVFTTIKNAIQVAFMFIGSLFSAAFQIITLPFRFIWENCKETVFAVWEAIKAGIQTAINAVKAVIETVFNFILAFITRVVNGWKNIITTVWNAIVTFLSPIIEKIKSIITTAFNNIKTNVTTILNAVKTVVSTVWNAITSVVTTVVNKIKTVVDTVWNAIKIVITTVVNAIKTVVTNVFNAVKTTVSTIFNTVKTKVTSIWNGIKTSITSIVNAIKTNITNGMNAAKTKVSSILDGIKNKFTNVFNNIKEFVKEKVDWLKGIFNFEWKLPDIKLPHFGISGGFSLNPPSVPSFSIDWYAKAMRRGMIMNEPTIFGFDAKTGKFLAGGEAGSEVVVGTGSLLSMIKSAVNSANSEILEQVASYCLTVVNAFKSLGNGILSVLNEALNVSVIFSEGVEVLKAIARDNARLSMNVREVTNALSRNANIFAIDYTRLANELANVLRDVPIQSNVAVEMQDGDIYMDTERVGRKVAPVVSRVVVR